MEQRRHIITTITVIRAITTVITEIRRGVTHDGEAIPIQVIIM
jgi:hypothetical protein